MHVELAAAGKEKLYFYLSWMENKLYHVDLNGEIISRSHRATAVFLRAASLQIAERPPDCRRF
jgi:hypothetical protein